MSGSRTDKINATKEAKHIAHSNNKSKLRNVTDKTKLKLDREVGGECFLETFEFKMVH